MIIPPDSYPDEGRTSILSPNHHEIKYDISDVQSKVASTTSEFEYNEPDHPRTDLDLHTNMVVLGRNAFIFESTRKKYPVKPFSSELGITDNIPIVDGAIVYDFQCSKQAYILIICNALYIPTMQHNLIPPFFNYSGWCECE